VVPVRSCLHDPLDHSVFDLGFMSPLAADTCHMAEPCCVMCGWDPSLDTWSGLPLQDLKGGKRAGSKLMLTALRFPTVFAIFSLST
jgi:hypothetical protein